MRSVFATLLLTFVGAAGPAVAQTSATWTSPDGALEHAIPDGWVAAPTEGAGILSIRPETDGTGVACFVQADGQPGQSAMTQEQHNSILDLWASRSFPQRYRRDTVIESGAQTIDGVRIFSFEVAYRNSDEGRREKVRVFTLAQTNSQYRVSCTSVTASPAVATAAADQFLSSLRISASRQ